MTTSQKVSLPIVVATVVFLLVAAYGWLPAAFVLAAMLVRMFMVGGVVAVVRKPKSS
jgi:hypothetical protein